ncbi:MAG TPA: 2Fe-2S iron-sulfur cluster-binding protein [Pseudonocardia sp.]|nr:2Fe-2S iron-sulfur cluster-binding protein [Pseudonocardia sp.]
MTAVVSEQEAGAVDVRVAGSEIVFNCRPDETVLDAAERAGYALPYSCRKGVCAACEATLTSGNAHVPGRGLLVGPAERVALCRAVPRSAVEIAPGRIGRAEPPARRTMVATVHKISHPAPDVSALALRYPIGKRVRFRAGQYLTVHLPGGDTRNYSMANPPHRNDAALLHVRRVPGGEFSDRLLSGLRRGDRLTVTLPFGEFGVDHDSTRPILLAVTGTGFAPAKSIIEDLIQRGVRRPARLYWGARRPPDLYAADLVARWAARYGWFRFIPVLSAPPPGWTGHTGHVQRAVLAEQPDLREHDVYACGNPAMTADLLAELTTRGGLPPARFHADAFLPTGDAEPAPAG